MLRRAEFLAWLEAMGLDPRDVAGARFVPEPETGPESPVRLLVTLYCRDETGKRYLDRRLLEQVAGVPVATPPTWPGATRPAAYWQETTAAVETRMVECPSVPTSGYRYQPDDLARMHYEAHEALAPGFGVPSPGQTWDQVPINDRALLTAVAEKIRPVFTDQPTGTTTSALRDEDFGALLVAYLVADPHPWDSGVDEVFRDLLDAESRRRGYDSWVEAYHDPRHRAPCFNGSRCEGPHCPPLPQAAEDELSAAATCTSCGQSFDAPQCLNVGGHTYRGGVTGSDQDQPATPTSGPSGEETRP